MLYEMWITYFWRSITKTMNKKLFFFFNLIIASILIVCLYLLACYGDFKIQDTFLKTFMDASEDADKFIKAEEYREKGIKTILLWNTMFGRKDFYFGKGDIFRNCPINKCKIFDKRDYLNIEDYDAILFHGNELDKYDVPSKRDMKQFYVYVNLESPANRAIPYKYYEDYFNLTMTYRLDSDIPWTYDMIEDVKSGKFVAPSRDVDWSASQNYTNITMINPVIVCLLTNTTYIEYTGTNQVFTGVEKAVDEMPSAILDIVRGKSKLVTWFVSNCDAKSGRMEYVQELSKYIGVDIYGKCGKFSCNRSKDCFGNVIEPNYFFYLSFENSFCDDYVTEKLMNPLRYNVIPVVYGGANYSQFAPPNSYVNALDFDSPKELVAYLKYLSQDLRRYQSFLEWKKYYRVKSATKRAVCTLCEVLHKQKEPKMYSTLSDWYAKDKCPIQTRLNDINKYATKITNERKQN